MSQFILPCDSSVLAHKQQGQGKNGIRDVDKDSCLILLAIISDYNDRKNEPIRNMLEKSMLIMEISHTVLNKKENGEIQNF